VFYGALPGEVLFDERNQAHAAKLGRILFDDGYKPVQESYLCPVCGSDIFQFISQNEIKCMVCRHTGAVALENESIRVAIEPGQPSDFWTYEEAKEHKGWLKGMKNKFLEHKTQLKEISVEYRHDGKWIV
jgi:hypothetical protein